MKLFKHVFAAATTVLMLTAFSSSASAAITPTPVPTYNFDYKCAFCTIKEISFDLLATPTVSSVSSTSFTITNVATSIGLENLSFFLSGNYGGFRVDSPTSNTTLADVYGLQLFTGTLSNPTFTLGTFATTTTVGCTNNCAGQLVISSSVPEPTTVALLGLGLLGFAASRHKAAKK